MSIAIGAHFPLNWQMGRGTPSYPNWINPVTIPLLWLCAVGLLNSIILAYTVKGREKYVYKLYTIVYSVCSSGQCVVHCLPHSNQIIINIIRLKLLLPVCILFVLLVTLDNLNSVAIILLYVKVTI